MGSVDFGSIADLTDQAHPVLNDDFSAIVQDSGYGTLLSDLGIVGHEHFNMFGPILGDQTDDRQNYGGTCSAAGEGSAPHLSQNVDQDALDAHGSGPSSNPSSQERS